MLALVAKIFAERTARIRCDVLHGRRIGGSSRHDDGIAHRALLLECLHYLRDSRSFLANGDVDANDIATFLVDDCIQRKCSLAGLPVTNDQLALSAANRNHTVDGLDAGLQRLFYGLPVHNTRRDALQRVELVRINWTAVVDGLT